ncbi:hypothetical protein KC343_g8 [Hortaea werneckii]|nr:hypothetical protein KC343_g8 [Hortaea werneckii]
MPDLGILLCLHLCGVLVVVIPLWVMAPSKPVNTALFDYTNLGGWDTKGLAALVGMVTPLNVLIGYDCTVHMGRSGLLRFLHDASITLPKVIIWSVAPNACLGLLVILTLAFCSGDMDEVLQTRTGEPFVQIFCNATESKAASSVMVAIVIILLVSCCFSEVATASRQLWSFARDKGLPASSWLEQVQQGWNIPLRAVVVSFVVLSRSRCYSRVLPGDNRDTHLASTLRGTPSHTTLVTGQVWPCDQRHCCLRSTVRHSIMQASCLLGCSALHWCTTWSEGGTSDARATKVLDGGLHVGSKRKVQIERRAAVIGLMTHFQDVKAGLMIAVNCALFSTSVLIGMRVPRAYNANGPKAKVIAHRGIFESCRTGVDIASIHLSSDSNYLGRPSDVLALRRGHSILHQQKLITRNLVRRKTRKPRETSSRRNLRYRKFLLSPSREEITLSRLRHPDLTKMCAWLKLVYIWDPDPLDVESAVRHHGRSQDRRSRDFRLLERQQRGDPVVMVLIRAAMKSREIGRRQRKAAAYLHPEFPLENQDRRSPTLNDSTLRDTKQDSGTFAMRETLCSRLCEHSSFKELLQRPAPGEPLASFHLSQNVRKVVLHVYVAKINVALGGIIIPPPHRVDGLGELSTTAGIDAASVNPGPLLPSLSRYSTELLDLGEAFEPLDLGILLSLGVLLEADLFFLPPVRQNGIARDSHLAVDKLLIAVTEAKDTPRRNPVCQFQMKSMFAIVPDSWIAHLRVRERHSLTSPLSAGFLLARLSTRLAIDCLYGSSEAGNVCPSGSELESPTSTLRPEKQLDRDNVIISWTWAWPSDYTNDAAHDYSTKLEIAYSSMRGLYGDRIIVSFVSLR